MSFVKIRTVTLPDDRRCHVYYHQPFERDGGDGDGASSKVKTKADSQPIYRMKPVRPVPRRSSRAKK